MIYLKPEMESVEELYDYLNLKIPNSVSYESLNNLCFSLFCTIDILPENLNTLKITKEVLAITFMRIATEKNISECSTENHWINQIDKSLKIDKFPNLESARSLLGTN